MVDFNCMDTKWFFRKFTPQDALALYLAIKGDMVARHMATEGFTLDDCNWIIEDSLTQWGKLAYGTWAVCDKLNNNVIGWAGFKPWKEDEVEMLVVLGSGLWGFGKQIFEKLISIGFQKMNFPALYVLLPLTRKSFHFMKNWGFSDCGTEVFHEELFKKFKLGHEIKNR